MIDVTVLLLNDNHASTTLAPIEVFHAAGSLWNLLRGETPEPRFRVTAASIDGAPTTTPYGVGVVPQAAIAAVEHTDIVVVPASGLALDAQIDRHRAALPWLRDRHARGAHVAGICTGVGYLAAAGLLDGRLATTHWAVADDYRQRFPDVRWQTELFVTEDERVLCSGGVYAAIDLSLYLVEKFCGHEIAVRCAKSLLVDMPRRHQSGYAMLPVSRPHADERIRAVERHIEDNYADNLSVEALAALAHMSARNFIRRFKAATGRLPGNYVQTVRMSAAKTMLEVGSRSVQEIGEAVGYVDAAFFRSLFKRHTGMTPIEYRNRFCAPARPPDRARRGADGVSAA